MIFPWVNQRHVVLYKMRKCRQLNKILWESDEESLKLDLRKWTLVFSSFFTGITFSNLLHWACFWSKSGTIIWAEDQGETHYFSHYHCKCEEEKLSCVASAWSQAKASASRPGCKWTPLGWYATASKAVPDIWWRDVMAAPAVRGTAVHFPLERAELPSPRGFMACVCMGESVSKRKHARILTRCARNTLIPRCGNINNCTQVNWEPRARTLHNMFPNCEVNWFIHSRFQCGQGGHFWWSDEVVDTCSLLMKVNMCLSHDHCRWECCRAPGTLCFLSREAQENLRKKCCWCMHWYMIDASPLWPGQAFTLSQHSSHHDCVPLEV